VLGFTGSWATEDALHCRTMGVPDRGTLRIDHVPFRTDQIVEGDYEITAEIVPLSAEPLISGSTRIYYSVDGSFWESVPLTATIGNQFAGAIPVQPEESVISYYLEAADESGRIEHHPYIGAPGAHRFTAICLNHPEVDVSPDGPLYACPGHAAPTLTANLTGGGGPFGYQWTRDGAPVAGATSPEYVPADSGAHTYNCQVLGDGCVTPQQDDSGVQILWQAAPEFAGIGSVADAQQPTCAVDLAWEAAFAPCGGPVTYDIYRSPSPFFVPGPSTLHATGVVGESYRDVAGLQQGTIYYYLVRAVDGSNGAVDDNLVKLSGGASGPPGGGGFCATGGSVVTVPDGSEGTTSPLRASRSAEGLSLSWDTGTLACASPGYHLIWGWGSTIDSLSVAGSDCTLDASGNHLWTTSPDTSSGWAWFLVVGDDEATIEGGWGIDSASNPRSLVPSGECGGLYLDAAICLPE
jgi:hypothetical protein